GGVDDHGARLTVSHRLHRLLPDLRLATASTDRPGEGAVWPQHHGCPGLARRRPLGRRHGRYDACLAPGDRLTDFAVYLKGHRLPPSVALIITPARSTEAASAAG